jgi:hypothetical protein
MKLFSLNSLLQHAGETLKRFPQALLFSAAATVAMIVLISRDFKVDENFEVMRFAMATYIGMLLTISVALYTERFTFSGAKKYAAWIFAIALVVFYYFSVPNEVDEISGVRFMLFSVGLHLLVSFSPFLVRGEVNGMWQFNKSIFIRILTSGLYSGVLYAGLALAMLAVDQLFDVKVEDKYYGYLWFTIAGIFNTWFFLSGVPKNLASLNDETSYPKGLKIFTMYVLLPLITIYMVILYAYAAKIVITGNWPVGWVGYMVIAFAIFGILSFLLIHPLRDDEANPWVKFYSRLFYFLLIVPIILLFTAIYKRINQYGITEERYFVLVLAFWLSFIVLYFIATKGKNFRVIPVSLCIVVFLSAFGPWGAFNVSHNSQFKELTALLDSNHVLLNGKVDTSKSHDVSSKDYERIKDITQYLNRMHGIKKLQSYFTANLDTVTKTEDGRITGRWSEGNRIFDLFKLNKIVSADDSPYLNFRTNSRFMQNTEGYDFVKEFNIYSRNQEFIEDFFTEEDSVHLVYSEETGQITLSGKNVEPLTMNFRALLDSLPKEDDNYLSQSQLTLEADNRQWKAKIMLSELSVERENGEIKLNRADGLLMLLFNNSVENEVGEKGMK